MSGRKPTTRSVPPAIGAVSTALNLSKPVHTRISPQADTLLRAEAARRYVKPATLARDLIYKGLGLIADPLPKKRT